MHEEVTLIYVICTTIIQLSAYASRIWEKIMKFDSWPGFNQVARCDISKITM